MAEEVKPRGVDLRDTVPLVSALEADALGRIFPQSSPPSTGLLASPVQRLIDDGWLKEGVEVLTLELFDLARSRRFREIVPPLIAAAALKRPQFSTRLERRCQRQGIETWGQILDLRPNDVLAWEGAGRKTALELVAAAIRTGMQVATQQLPGEPSAENDSGISVAASPVEEPAEFDATPPLDPIELAKELLTQMPSRERRIFLSRSRCDLEPILTLVELGSEFHVTRQRIEQIEKRTFEDLRDELERERFAPLASHITTIKTTLGVIAHVSDVPDALHPALVAFTEDGTEATIATLLLWLAGPYERHEEWLVRADAGRLEEKLLKTIRTNMRGRLISIAELAPLVGNLGLRDERWRTWAAHQPSLRTFDDFVADWRGSRADKAEIILRLHGGPLTDEEIFEQMHEDISLRGLRNQLLEDPRFTRRDRKRFGLVEWGGDEYLSIQTHMLEELDRLGGEGRVTELVNAITARFPDVKANSIWSYANSSLFVRTAPGTIRGRRANEPFISTQRIELERDCFLVGDHWTLRVRVTDDHLRGSGFPIPEAFATTIGLRPGSTVEFSSDLGVMSAGWRAAPFLGSIRSHIEALKLHRGDFAFVTCIPPNRISLRALRQDKVASVPQDQRAKLLVGAEGDESDTISVVGYAVGLLSPSQQTLVEIRSRLQQKRTEDVLELLPDTDQPVSVGAARVRSLIQGGETDHVEFKSTFEWDLREKRHLQGLNMMALKTIAAFLNSEGGELLVGVGDNGDIVGLEHDYAAHNDSRDKFELHLTNILTSHFGTDAVAALTRRTFVRIDDRDVCHIAVRPSPEPAYVKKGSNQEFYIRVGNQTRSLTFAEAAGYLAKRFYRAPDNT